MSQNVSDQIVEFLTGLGVKQIYGIPGDTIDSLMESLRKQNKIKFIVLRHEETGAIAASAHGKLTGELGVCVACQGPGAIHLLNGLYDAALDGAPVLAITGQIPSTLIGSGMPQEIDQIALFNSVCVYNQELREPAQLIPTLISACQAALSKRGVAHISIPSDTIRAAAIKHTVNYDLFKSSLIELPVDSDLQKAADLINSHEKVTVLFGEGARGASAEVQAFAEAIKAPLVHTTRSKDIIDNRHPQFIGGIGLMGSYAGNHAIQHCELLLIIGSSFAFQEYYPEKAKVIQLDINPMKISKHTHVDVALIGEAKPSLTCLTKKIKEKTNDAFLKNCLETKHLNQKLEDWEKRPGTPIHPQALTEKISQHLPDNAVICTDVGEVTVWCNNFLTLTGKQRYIWSANLASLGTGLAEAIGAKLCYPDRQVICLVGDGGFNMLIGDFATAVRYKLAITFIVFNNSEYGFIGLEEQGEGNPTFGTDLCNPNFAALAKAFGGDGVVVTDYQNIEEALQKGFSANTPFVIDVHTNPKEKLIPPVVTAKMVVAFAESQLKTWFEKPATADKA